MFQPCDLLANCILATCALLFVITLQAGIPEYITLAQDLTIV